MTSHLFAICFDANDPLRLARFWAGVLSWEMADDPDDGIALLPGDDTGLRIRFLPAQQRKAGQNRMHVDLTGTALEEQQQTVARSLRVPADRGFLGALACDGAQEVGYFWSEALGRPLVWDRDEETAISSSHRDHKITWDGPPVAPETGKNRLHVDLAPPVDGDQQAEVERLVSLGATRIDIGQGEVGWVVMADPEGNEFCVLTPR
jgi:hypothetical protein